MTDAPLTGIKRVLIGRPMASRELGHQLLPKWMALPVFSSDPLSSVAYATEEMMLVLALAGAGAFGLITPLAAAVALLLVVVVTSYRQTVRAYPHGGGAYIVARQNLGDIPGLTAASALLIDYVLTVSVSIAAGVAAITSAVPPLSPHRVLLAIGFVLLVMSANLRGVKEAGTVFALPTYTFVVVMGVLIVTGLVRCLSGCPAVPFTDLGQPEAEAALTLFLVLHAFSSGSTALTGIEAISNGVPAFRYPQSRNAATTLGIMGAIAVLLFAGISFLATHIDGIAAYEGLHRTVTSQIAGAVFGPSSLGFYLVQIVTAAILILAANTAYQDFPRLSSVLASDRFLPRQFLARGDRLVFSNGIAVLTILAVLLLVVFDADVSRLIQLYVVGVFTSFTLSQAGMVRHWLAVREPRWRRSLTINAVGAATTAVVLVIVAYTKFASGAWIVIVAIPVVVFAMGRIRRHYQQVSIELRAGVAEPDPPRRHRMLILEDRVDAATAAALSYAYGTHPVDLRALAPRDAAPDVADRWHALAPDVPLDLLDPSRGVVDAFAAGTRSYANRHPDSFTVAIVPETRSGSWLEVIRRHRRAQRVKSALVGERSIVVANVVANPGPLPSTIAEPVTHHVIVLVAGVHNATLRALAYAKGLGATTVTALSISLEREGAERMLNEWDDWDIDVPLELVDSPFRSIAPTLRTYIRGFHADGTHTFVTCVLPEFVLDHWWHRLLHNQTALLIKSVLLFEPGVVTTSIPYPISGRG
ncbi:MAG: APC family permease [Egibacteraceae bacterium]